MRRPPNAGRVPTFVAAPDPRRRGVEPVETLEDWEPAEGIRGSSRQQAGASRSLHALLWTLLIGAVLLGLVGLLNVGARRPPGAGTAPVAVAVAEQAPPGGCAELLVGAWLAGDSTVLAGLVSGDVPRLPVKQRAAAHTYTINARPGGPAAGVTTWSYLIGADVVSVDKQGRTAPAGTQFFTVTLARNAAAGPADNACGGWAAPVLPAQVAGLAAAPRQDLVYDRSVATSGQPLADTLGPFFTALLAGGAEVERYLAPGTTVAAVLPAPYAQVRLERLTTVKGADIGTAPALPADGTRVQLLATVAARVGDQPGEWRLTYPLVMTVRGGRWEVTAIEAAPALAATQPVHTPPAGTRPATPSTSTPAPTAPRTTR